MNPSTSTASHSSSNRGSVDSLYQVKLLSALRSGDPAVIHPFLAGLSKEKRNSTDSDVDLGAAALHLAIRCATCDTVALLLSHRSISPNAIYPPGSGTTALHLAASLSRTDVVNLLLDQEGIDDSLRDSHGRTCLEVAKDKVTIRAIRDSRSFLTASYRSLLRTYILSSANAPPPEALVKLLSSPRITPYLQLVELAVRAGADVFVRDRRGRMVYDGVGKDDRVRVFLRQFTNRDTTLINTPSSEPPELKGYLNKYTNVAKGYNTRWFVLKDGVLSYYRHQDDEQVASRGSIAMKTAIVSVAANSSGLRFEVHSTPSRGHQNIQKWYLKANHPVEASRWIQGLQKSMEWAKRDSDAERKSGESDAHSFKPPSTLGTHFSRRKDAGTSNGVGSTTSSITGNDSGDASLRKDGNRLSDDQDQENEDSSFEFNEQVPPHSHIFELQGNSLITQMELTSQLFTNLPASASASATPRAVELNKAVEDAFASVHGMLVEYIQMVRDREEWYKAKLDRERERQNVWEESLQAVVKEGDAIEKELRSTLRRRRSTIDRDTVRRRPSQLATPPVAEEPPTVIVKTPSSLLSFPLLLVKLPVGRR
ncbi:Oxysterol-binding C2F12.05c [Grifola frondosa]|uniref:Oxysterol-binding C2F12.05c n=1 Tax=Grifola frondosa TaxID=5627 RepID=A0A1C7MNY3_GRIFR|nr:Oxysterol-binding C2F12.05c [Grifola frondosa]